MESGNAGPAVSHLRAITVTLFPPLAPLLQYIVVIMPTAEANGKPGRCFVVLAHRSGDWYGPSDSASVKFLDLRAANKGSRQ